MTPRADTLRVLLVDCAEKLHLYRAVAGGNYVGGIESTALAKRIDAAMTALSAPPATPPADADLMRYVRDVLKSVRPLAHGKAVIDMRAANMLSLAFDAAKHDPADAAGGGREVYFMRPEQLDDLTRKFHDGAVGLFVTDERSDTYSVPVYIATPPASDAPDINSSQTYSKSIASDAPATVGDADCRICGGNGFVGPLQSMEAVKRGGRWYCEACLHRPRTADAPDAAGKGGAA